MSRLAYCIAWTLLSANVLAADGYFGLHSEFEISLRAQSPDGGSLGSSPPSGSSPYNPFSPPSSAPQDPFLSPAEPFQPTPPPTPAVIPLFGSNNFLPYRYGWTPKLDLAYLPSSNTSPDAGNFSAFELDSELVYNTPLGPDLVFTASPQFNYRHWDATSQFNLDLFRFGLNLQLSTPVSPGSWGYQIAFNPSVNTDFHSTLANESVNLDANGMLFYNYDPSLMIVLGVGYLDRVHDIIIPYAGVIYRPDDLWEFRLLFPQGRISRYAGYFWWGHQFLYLAWEFHVDAFQVATPTDAHNKIQYEDYRVTFGLRSDHVGFTKYIEAGYIFGRSIDYRYTLPGFDINDGFIVRGGIRF